MKYYLATTGISEIWDLERDLLLLGPWCIKEERNRALIKDKDYRLVPSPWEQGLKIKEASDYCYQVYKVLLPQLSWQLNLAHGVSYTERYWKILLGPWLLHFIEILYDRYKRIENTLDLFSDFYTSVLPKEQCKLTSFDTHEFIFNKDEDYYNLALFSLIANKFCPSNIIEKDYKAVVEKPKPFSAKVGKKMKLTNRIAEPFRLFCRRPVLLTDMYHITWTDRFFLKWKTGLNKISFVDFEPFKQEKITDNYSNELRGRLRLKGLSDGFESLLCELIPYAIPLCYVENYKLYRDSLNNIRNLNSVKIIGSAVGWYFNERFKFFAAEAVSKVTKLVDFQHGGGYGLSLAGSRELLSLEKDIFYTWGWDSAKEDRIKPLPSPHLSRLKDTHLSMLDSIIFVGTSMPKYHYRFHTLPMPEDMSKYFEDKKIFFQFLTDEIRRKVLYRPFGSNRYIAEELKLVKETCPQVNFILEGSLVSWMKKVKLAVIDHPHTAFLEALIINVPCVFYWDHGVYLMRPDAEEYFELLRDAGILFKDPLSAAKRVKEIFNNPRAWWLEDGVQKARLKFCNRYAYARKDWIDVWSEELKQLSKIGQIDK